MNIHPIKRRVSGIRSWEHIPVRPGFQSLHNLHVLSVNGIEVGFIERPRDTRTEQSAWRCFFGIGETAKFLGHAWTKDGAMVTVEGCL